MSGREDTEAKAEDAVSDGAGNDDESRHDDAFAKNNEGDLIVGRESSRSPPNLQESIPEHGEEAGNAAAPASSLMARCLSSKEPTGNDDIESVGRSPQGRYIERSNASPSAAFSRRLRGIDEGWDLAVRRSAAPMASSVASSDAARIRNIAIAGEERARDGAGDRKSTGDDRRPSALTMVKDDSREGRKEGDLDGSGGPASVSAVPSYFLQNATAASEEPSHFSSSDSSCRVMDDSDSTGNIISEAHDAEGSGRDDANSACKDQPDEEAETAEAPTAPLPPDFVSDEPDGLIIKKPTGKSKSEAADASGGNCNSPLRSDGKRESTECGRKSKDEGMLLPSAILTDGTACGTTDAAPAVEGHGRPSLELDTELGMAPTPTAPLSSAGTDEDRWSAVRSGEGDLLLDTEIPMPPSPPSSTGSSRSGSRTTTPSVTGPGTSSSEVPSLATTTPIPGFTAPSEGTEQGEERRPVVMGVLQNNDEVFDGVPVPSRNEERPQTATSQQSNYNRHQNKIIAVIMLASVIFGVSFVAAHMSRKPSNHEPSIPDIPQDFVDAVPSLVASREPQENQTPSLSASPTSQRFLYIKHVLSPVPSDTALALEDPSTPQYRALVWLAEEDERQVDWWDVAELVQRFAVATLYFSMGGPDSWTEDCNFLSSEHECLWNTAVPEDGAGVLLKGVLCSQDHVTIDFLSLTENNASGVLPDELGLLAGLKYLGLWRNGLSGTIPTALGRLKNLQFLDLSENSFSGTLPISLGGLAELQALALNLNKLTGPIPTALGKLIKLRVLALGYNQLTGTIPVELNHLSKLEGLFLNTNFLNGTLPISAGSLQNLWLLSMRENNISGTIPAALFTLSSLTTIDFWGNALTGTLSPQVGKLTRLESLQVPLNFLSGTLPPSLMGLSQLYWLSLFENAFTGTIPMEVGNLTELQLLYLNGNRFGGTIPKAMGDLTKLVDLWLGVNLFTGHVPPSLAKLKALGTLYLHNNSFTGDLGFLCNASFVIFEADCHGDDPEVACECCNICCSDELIGPVDGCFSTRH